MLKLEMEDLQEYQRVVAKGKNSRNFSNWLSGWSEPKKKVAEGTGLGFAKNTDEEEEVCVFRGLCPNVVYLSNVL